MAKKTTSRRGTEVGKPSKPSSGTIDAFLGRLQGQRKKVATIGEINEATARGWAGKK